MAKMLRRLEEEPRKRLEAVEVPYSTGQWVAGGRTREGRALRAEVAMYVRERRKRETERNGWPEPWVLSHFAKLHEKNLAAQRDRGLRRPTVAESCDRQPFPTAPPPSRRRARRGSLRDLAAIVAEQSELAQRQAVLAQATQVLVQKATAKKKRPESPPPLSGPSTTSPQRVRGGV